MDQGINKHTIVGTVVSQPHYNVSGGGVRSARFRVVTIEEYKDRLTLEVAIRRDWHLVVAWGDDADHVKATLQEGSSVYIEGPSRTRKWVDKSNATHYSTETHVRVLIALTGAMPGQERQQTAPEAGLVSNRATTPESLFDIPSRQ